MSSSMHGSPIVMTLDAGGTFLKFSAICDGAILFEPIPIPSDAHDLDRCLRHVIEGFELVRDQLPRPPVAISFAFPGPSDYRNGIVRDLPNLPGFRGGVALGPMLEDYFRIPVYMNNDGDLFAYGEALDGFLPHVNGLLQAAGSPRRYGNLLGVTFGTGFGGGLVTGGRLFLGDNCAGMEIGLLRNKVEPGMNVEQSLSINAIKRVYARVAGIAIEAAPDPDEIARIAQGNAPGNSRAALESWRTFGEAAGDAIAQALTLADGMVVIGGGLSGASPLFLPALVEAANGCWENTPQGRRDRLFSRVYNLEDSAGRDAFIKGDVRMLPVPGSARTVSYDPVTRVGVGLSRLGTSQAVAVGAYAYALQMLAARTHS